MKYSVKVNLQNIAGNSKPIRLRVSFAGERVDLAVGAVYDADKWQGERPKRGTQNANRQSAAEVQHIINTQTERVDAFFSRCELDGVTPTPALLRSAYAEHQRQDKPSRTLLCQYINDFLSWFNKVRQPSDTTYYNMQYQLKAVSRFMGMDVADSVTEYYTIGYQEYLSKRGYKNTTIESYLVTMRKYLRYLRQEKGLDIPQQVTHKITKIKDDTKSYLTADELKKLYEYHSDNESHELSRDYFIFGCFCGLRFSDIKKLKKAEVNTQIHTITKKTKKPISIELNKYTSEIIAKYADSVFDTILPPISISSYNDKLKLIFKKLGFDTPILQEYYQGTQRMQEMRPKWQILASHSARRTFVVMCLQKGVPPLVVIRWTGHSDIKTLDPYIAIVDEQKKSEMNKLNDDL